MGQVRHGSATTTHAVRAAIQRSQASLAQLSRELGINPKTVAKWRKRATVEDLKTGPKEPRSTVLTEEEEAAVVAFRRHTLLPLDDCLYALQPSIPHLTRSALPRKEVVFISDFQKSGWERQEEIHMPEGTVITPISVATLETSGLAVASVSLQRSSFSNEERVTITAGLTNRGAAPFNNVPVTLEVDGRRIVDGDGDTVRRQVVAAAEQADLAAQGTAQLPVPLRHELDRGHADQRRQGQLAEEGDRQQRLAGAGRQLEAAPARRGKAV